MGIKHTNNIKVVGDISSMSPRPPVYQIPNIIPPSMLELPSFGMYRASAGFTKLPEPDEWKRALKTLIGLQPRSLDTK